jgi:hypothetical protein
MKTPSRYEKAAACLCKEWKESIYVGSGAQKMNINAGMAQKI